MHYFWRYAGYLLGVDESLLTTTLEEQEIMALQLTSHLLDPTPDSESLAKALPKDMSNKAPFNLSYDVLLAFSRYLIETRSPMTRTFTARFPQAQRYVVKTAIRAASFACACYLTRRNGRWKALITPWPPYFAGRLRQSRALGL